MTCIWLDISIVNCFPDRLLKVGRKMETRMIEKKREMNERRIDSTMNCFMRCDFCAPVTFLMPTSLILVEDLAVAKFMKLIQAMSKTKAAMTEKMYTYLILPPPDRLYRWILVNG